MARINEGFDSKKNNLTIIFVKWGMYIYAALLILINLIRVSDNNFWGDEAFSIQVAKMSLSQMITVTANDVHPPLYYACLIILSDLLGRNNKVYHLVSVIPYLLVVIFTITVIRRRFGVGSSLLFLTFISISAPALTYNIEVRMYSLASAFVLWSYYSLLLVFEKKREGYVLFVIMSLCAAYTHYYALFAVAIFYLALLIRVIRGRETLSRLLGVYLSTVIGYLPWLAITITTFMRTSHDFWMTGYPGAVDCAAYFFSSDVKVYSLGMFAITVLTVIVIVVRESGLIAIKKSEASNLGTAEQSGVRTPASIGSEDKVVEKTDNAGRLSVETIWSVWGVLASVGLVVIGEIISVLIRPSFSTKYMYPVIACFWLVLSVNAFRLEHGKYIGIAILLLSLIIYVPEYISTYMSDKAYSDLCDDTANQMNESLDDGDMILTNSSHLDWSVLDYYVPKANHMEIETGYSDLSEGKVYYLAWTRELTDDDKEWLNQLGYYWSDLIPQAYLGENRFHFYKLETVGKTV